MRRHPPRSAPRAVWGWTAISKSQVSFRCTDAAYKRSLRTLSPLRGMADTIRSAIHGPAVRPHMWLPQPEPRPQVNDAMMRWFAFSHSLGRKQTSCPVLSTPASPTHRGNSGGRSSRHRHAPGAPLARPQTADSRREKLAFRHCAGRSMDELPHLTLAISRVAADAMHRAPSHIFKGGTTAK
jgi:hypothetical protein